MASENVEIVRRLYDCFRMRDNETPFEYYAEDIVWDARGAEIPGLEHVYHGHEGIRAFWRQWLEAWDEIQFVIEDPVELDDGRVEVRVRQRNRGKGAGIWIDQPPYLQFWTIDDGKVTRLEFQYVVKG
jgi:ketosteroid isomerase-like protein